MTLIHKNKTSFTYIWIDDTGIRSKILTFDKRLNSLDDLPLWSVDDIQLKPVAIFTDPFLLKKNKLVLCETFKSDEKPKGRVNLVNSVKRAGTKALVFTIEQEFTLIEFSNLEHLWPTALGFNTSIDSNYYYSPTSSNEKYGIDVAQGFFKLCQQAGLNVLSCEATKVESKWKIKFEAMNGETVFDHLWISRYILNRIAKEYGIMASLDDPLNVSKSVLSRNGVLVKFSTTKKLINDPDCPVLNAVEAFFKGCLNKDIKFIWFPARYELDLLDGFSTEFL